MPLGDSLAACQRSRAAGSHPGGGRSRAQRSVAHPGGELGQGWVAGWRHPHTGKTSPTPVCGVSWSETLPHSSHISLVPGLPDRLVPSCCGRGGERGPERRWRQREPPSCGAARAGACR